MNSTENNFFIYTNPLFWIYFIIMASYYLIKEASNFLGLNDWYYVLFKLKNMKPKHKRDLVLVNTIRQTKFFWLKSKAWEYAVKIIEKENQSQNN